jgi:ribosomal protein S18 acetylase RimI-like enzyme
MTEEVFVRPAYAAERPHVERLLSLSMTLEGLMPLSGPDFERTWRTANQPGAAFRFFIADLAGTGVVGMMSLHTHFSTYAGRPILRLEDVIVATEHRGHGIGRALVQFANDFAAQIGAARVELVVGKSNRAARRLYETSGFLATSYVRYDKVPRRS